MEQTTKTTRISFARIEKEKLGEVFFRKPRFLEDIVGDSVREIMNVKQYFSKKTGKALGLEVTYTIYEKN